MSSSRQQFWLSYSSVAILLSGVVIFRNVLLTSSTSYGTNETDHLDLISFKNLITHDPYGVLSSWNSSFHFCDWAGVTCGKRHKRVTKLHLQSQGLVGSLSPSVGNLSFLREINVSNNVFQGQIPPELGRLFRLQILDLQFNSFNGVIPTNLSRCSNLVRLALYANKLVGNLPEEVSSLSKLTFLGLSRNKLSGGIPPFLGNMTSLNTLFLSSNPLTGSIPNTFGRLNSLTRLGLGDCNLSGTIPPSIYNNSLIYQLSLAENQLSGSLPSDLGQMLPHLQQLQLQKNRLTGSLPPSLSNCSLLEKFELDTNHFSGMLKLDFAGLRPIKWILLSYNNFGSGDLGEMDFFDSMANCSQLQALELSHNRFEGMLPNSMVNLSSELFFFNIDENFLYGRLPSSIGNLIGLGTMSLGRNRLSGQIPTSIGELPNLHVLNLAENQFSGSIPDSLGNLSLLIELYLVANRLEGTIPSSLGNLTNLLLLSLSQNNLTGEIPGQILQLSSLTISLDIAQNNLFGSLPSEVGALKNLGVLDLSENYLSGNVPSSLSGCSSLEKLFLQGNLFQGQLPSSLSLLKGIIELDLSRNNFSDQIPRFMEEFHLLRLNLSFNDFEGEVPVTGPFANASVLSVYGNDKLCGGLPELLLPKCSIKKSKHLEKEHMVIIVTSVVCSILVLTTILFFMSLWRRKNRKHQISESLSDAKFLKVSYDQLFKATDGFSEANLIGVGGFSSVYKGNLRDVETTVAVKVLNLVNKAGYKSFMAECEALRNIRHRNLVKIITACSSVDFQGNDFKALVYEFMPNGSLENWVHRGPRLALIQMMDVLIDVATALDYLHNLCQTPIVHCDIKPSNILLDEDMIVHVADFGLARFLQTNSNQNSSIGIKGTVGYAAPEYGLGSEPATSGDVYSFGILLLEMMIGKRPTDEMFNESLNLRNFAKTGFTDHLTDVVDFAVVNLDEKSSSKRIEECVVSVLKIGISCSADSPQDRSNIQQVLHELKRVRASLRG